MVWREPMFRGYAGWMRQQPFRAALDRVWPGGDGTAVMCSESVWWRCHRRLSRTPRSCYAAYRSGT